MVIKLDFDNPVYIARDELPDLLKVSFHNTEIFMPPKDPNKQPIPSGYTQFVEVPLQTDDDIPILDISDLETFVLTVFLVQYTLGYT